MLKAQHGLRLGVQKPVRCSAPGAVIVMDETTDMVKVLQRISRFYYSESCGQCTPCREGTGWLYRMVTRIVKAKGRPDLDKLDSVASKMEGRTICALGDAAAMPVRSFVKHLPPRVRVLHRTQAQ
jgi:NADH-quinone oxidoreductase subunit F